MNDVLRYDFEDVLRKQLRDVLVGTTEVATQQ